MWRRNGLTRQFPISVTPGAQLTQQLDWSTVRATGTLAISSTPSQAKVSVDGKARVVRPGKDVTLVSYGATLRIVMEAAELLAQTGIDAEVIDVQTLLPFDLHGVIVESLKKTNRVAFIDEDVPGGATAFMMQNVLERDGGYEWLDSEPRTLPAKEHRPAYGSDGDYWSKPNRETIFECVYELMHEAMPRKFPKFL